MGKADDRMAHVKLTFMEWDQIDYALLHDVCERCNPAGSRRLTLGDRHRLAGRIQRQLEAQASVEPHK